VKKAAYCCPTDWTLVRLHTHNLTAIDTKAHVSAGKYNSILIGRVADYTFFLALVDEVCGNVVNSIDVIEVHNLIIVEELLLQEFEPESVCAIIFELTVGKLDVLFALSAINFWINRFYRDD